MPVWVSLGESVTANSSASCAVVVRLVLFSTAGSVWETAVTVTVSISPSPALAGMATDSANDAFAPPASETAVMLNCDVHACLESERS